MDRPAGVLFPYEGLKFPPNPLLSLEQGLNLFSWEACSKGSEPLCLCLYDWRQASSSYWLSSASFQKLPTLHIFRLLKFFSESFNSCKGYDFWLTVNTDILKMKLSRHLSLHRNLNTIVIWFSLILGRDYMNQLLLNNWNFTCSFFLLELLFPLNFLHRISFSSQISFILESLWFVVLLCY